MNVTGAGFRLTLFRGDVTQPEVCPYGDSKVLLMQRATVSTMEIAIE
jgi:hypothetical protein